MTARPCRLVVLALVWMPIVTVAWLLAGSRDWDHTWDEFQLGRGLEWPPPNRGPRSSAVSDHVTALALRFLLIGLGIGAIFTTIVVTRRLVERRRRAQSMARWELRLGRDDLTNPYHVQEAFEGIAGAIGVRWYERLWRGPEHFALEVHKLPDASVRFVLAAPSYLEPAISGPLEDLYPDVELQPADGAPDWAGTVVRLKKAGSFVLSIQTTRNYEHAFSETLVALMGKSAGELSVQLVLVPASGSVHRRARALLKRRERGLQQADRRDPGELGIDSIVEAKELKGALELQHRTLYLFDLRVAGEDSASVKRVAGLFSQLRSENELTRRQVRMRRGTYARRIAAALPNPLPSLRTGVLSTSELATVWQLPRGRVKHGGLLRSSVRRASAPAGIDRSSERVLMQDEHGAVTIAARDRKYGHALIGGQGGGKTSVMARHFVNDAADEDRAVILIDPKGPLAELCIGLAPASKTVHYLDLGHPEIGINPLAIPASAGARAAVFLQALIEANPAGAIQAASDSFLRQAIYAVCLVESAPTLWHVYRMLDTKPGDYREAVVERLGGIADADFARSYWDVQFPALLSDRGFAAQALNPPRNKIERLISTREIDAVLRHPITLDLEGIIERGEILIVAGAKATVGEDNTVLVSQLLLQLIHRALQARQELTETARRRVSLLIDEAHNVLTPSVAKMLAEGRSAGLEAVFAWQYSTQIRDEVIRSGVRSLLQSLSIFRMREMEDARSLAGLAMEVYSDRISVDQEEQERLRFSPDDIVRLPVHRALNVWVADGVPRPGFVAATLPMEGMRSEQLAAHHADAQRERGGRYPTGLSDPLLDRPTRDDRPTKAASRATPKPKPASRRSGSSSQLSFPMRDDE
ncbi:MAG: type IV secretory system conjugative DNA transfer family protein [Solirubrobacteraceae bacterium]|nr:type IV secretory system conjugative DNA transfer family protein [Solirubrobacteraceae bacterium]